MAKNIDSQNEKKVSRNTLSRLPYYLSYLKELKTQGVKQVSFPTIAKQFSLNEVLVKKDLSQITLIDGKPKVGHFVDQLINDIEEFLGYNNTTNAVLVGVGNLGSALLGYENFKTYGLEIVVAFDQNKNVVGMTRNNIQIRDLSEMEKICKRLHIHIGIITVPANQAQEICDKLVGCGIKAIWNFAQTHLKVPNDVLVQNVNLAASLSILSVHLKKMI